MFTYYRFEVPKNDKVLLLNETMASEIMSTTDVGKSRVTGMLFVDKNKLEFQVTEKILEKYPMANLTYDYLDNLNGALKAIKITMLLDDDEFTTTYKINERVGF